MQEIAGATTAGCASTLLGHPLDTVKVHLQTNPKLSNTLQATRSLLRSNHGNPLVFFRGISPPLVNAILMNTVMFSVFETVKQSLPDDSSSYFNKAFTAGVFSGVATACLSTPTDYVKIQSQLLGIHSRTVWMQLWTGNPTLLFRGHIANLGREGLFTMVYLGLYDTLKPKSASQQSIGLVQAAAIGGATGGLAWVASYPFDTVKSVMQASDVSIRVAVQTIGSRQGGLAAFYKGCAASTTRAVMVTSVRMIAYEWMIRFF